MEKALLALVFLFMSVLTAQAATTKEYRYDEKGNLAGYTENKTDESGRIVEAKNYDASGKLKADDTGVAIHRYKFDNNGNTIESKTYDALGELKADSSGIAVYRYKFDSNGHTTEERWFGVDDKLKADASGLAMYRYKHDKKGNMTEMSRYGIDEKLVEDAAGVAIYQYKYVGTTQENRTYGADGKIKGDVVRLRCNKTGNLCENRYYDTNGTPKEDAFGIFMYKTQYNENKSPIELKRYGTDRKLKNNSNGVAITKYEYKEPNGGTTKTIEYDKNNKLIREMIW